MFSHSYRAGLLAGVALLASVPAGAQTTPTTDPAVVPPPTATTVPTVGASKRVYTPADFARFAPRTAYDMLVQVPGFTIQSGNTGERGLGQANENVLINGERIANKSYGGGDAGALAELQRIGISNVERIEIVEAASVGIAGLSGQVANVIVKAQTKASGQFEWRPDFRAHFAKPRIFNGNVSYTGQHGPLTYTFGAKSQAGRGGYGGSVILRDPDGNIFESRDEIVHSESDLPTFSTKFNYDFPGTSVANLTLAYTPYWAPFSQVEERSFTDEDEPFRVRSTKQKLTGWYYDINADYEFDLGPGRLKLIGLQHWDKEPSVTTQIEDFEGTDPDEGVRFTRDARITETIGRAEYGWKMGQNDMQLSLERAFNKLDQRGKFEVLDPDGEFVNVPELASSGVIQEVRYEGIATWSRPLSSTMDIQIAAGGEISTLERIDDESDPRKFFRPKGSINLGWRPGKGWDASLKLRRRVGQISFYDFLDQLNLQQDRENEGNPDLVPPQSWELEGEVGRELGAWGKTRLKTWYHRVEDIIDVIPIGVDGQGVGNLPRATRMGIESTSTLQFEPIGWTGAKLDVNLGWARTRVKDPLTEEMRSISGTRDRWMSFEMRHDIAGTDYAWGLNASHDHYTKYYRLNEVFRSWEGPWWVGGFIEHKDIMGLTVRASVSNVLNARHRLELTRYEGFRDEAPIAFTRSHNQLIGPIFSFMVKGSF